MKRITHIHLENGKDHEHISKVKYVENGSTSEATRAEMVKAIEAKPETVVVGEGKSQVFVGVVKTESGLKYIRTYADGKWSNNLLSLPEF